MFKIDKVYEITLTENPKNPQTLFNCVVKSYDSKSGLLIVEQQGKEIIINIKSPGFLKDNLQKKTL